MLFGPRLNTVFASRWKALAWAGLVLLTAWCSVPAPEPAQVPDKPVAGHVSPWDIDKSN